MCYFWYLNRQFWPILIQQKHFYDNCLHKTFLQFILHTFWCILKHLDSFWAFKRNKNHFFDIFLQKTFAQFILHTFWYILMHIDAFWTLTKKLVNFNQKKEFFQITISCTKLKNYSFCKHFDAFWCIQMHFDAFYHNQM